MLPRQLLPFLKNSLRTSRQSSIVSRKCSTDAISSRMTTKKPLVTLDDILDPIGKRETEHFTFNHKEKILLNEEEEFEEFEREQAMYGKVSFSHLAQEIEMRDFEVSKNAEEWEFVERLLPSKLVPKILDLQDFHSGFQPPKINLDTDEAREIGYFVPRTANHMLPVYSCYDRSRDKVFTTVKKVDGNLFKLRDELDELLETRYKMKFISRVTELYAKITYQGDFEVDFKNYLLSKGF